MAVTLPSWARASWTRSPALLRRTALAALIANVVIVVTGGAVRLTGSGLGCPTWPSCTEGSLIPTKQYRWHGIIEFTNRQLTFVLVVVVLATLAAAILARRHLILAVLLAASIPAQAVLGGITVLTHLNPWTVAAHFLLSMLIIAIAFALWWRARERPALRPTSTALPAVGWVMAGVTVAVLVVGTVVTGSGPHAGDQGATHRIHIAPASIAQLHADLVMLLIGVTVCFALLARAAGAPVAVRRAGWWLLGIELSQGLIGYIQYFTHVPALLVGVHMLGACLVWIAALWVLGELEVRPLRTPVGARAEPAATSATNTPTSTSLPEQISAG